MKSLLIYHSPDGDFNEEHKNLVRIQVDNHLELGWKPEDIKLVTNFPYEYKIKALVVDQGACAFKRESAKPGTICHLFDLGFFDDDLYWCHDFDAYQLEPFNETELGLDGLDGGFTDYGRKPHWQMGSFFFKKSAEWIFREMVKRMKPGRDEFGRQMQEENVMNYMTGENHNDINSRIKRLNISYNFGMRKVGLCYEMAIKPLKVLHFHPTNPKLNTLAIAMHGRNDIKKPLMTPRLIRIFNRYGYS